MDISASATAAPTAAIDDRHNHQRKPPRTDRYITTRLSTTMCVCRASFLCTSRLVLGIPNIPRPVCRWCNRLHAVLRFRLLGFHPWLTIWARCPMALRVRRKACPSCSYNLGSPACRPRFRNVFHCRRLDSRNGPSDGGFISRSHQPGLVISKLGALQRHIDQAGPAVTPMTVSTIHRAFDCMKHPLHAFHKCRVPAQKSSSHSLKIPGPDSPNLYPIEPIPREGSIPPRLGAILCA